MGDGCDGFFKVLLDDFSENLRIPPKFVIDVIGKQEWQAVKLRSSLGKIWTVEIEEDADGYRYFGNGWADFVQGHDLQFGYFLVFDYGGDMGFFVRAYDHTACMIRYGDSIINGNLVDNDDDGGEEEYEILEKSKDCMREVIDLDRTEEENALHQQTKTEDNSQVDVSGKPKFRVTMRAYDLLSKTSMHIIPTSFLKSNNLTRIRKATLSNSAGNWTMDVHHRLRNKRMFNVFGNGWLTYFKGNKLKAGDVCIFELVSATIDTAHFFVTEVQNPRRTTSTPFTSKDNAEHANECLLGQRNSRCTSIKRPYFVIIIKKCHFSGSHTYLHIPASFSALDYLSKQSDVTVMDTNGKSWKMDVCLSHQNLRKYPRLCAGWSEFCHDKKVEEGDVCTFELISNGKKVKMLVDVQKQQSPPSFNLIKEESCAEITDDKSTEDIIDVENYEPKKDVFVQDVSSKKRIVNQQRCSRYPKRQKVARAKSSRIEQHNEFESSKKPQFLVTLKSFHFVRHSSSYLEVPKNFNGWKFFSGKRIVKLVNAKGESWLISLYRYKERVKFGAGWYACACDNGLKVGDLCRFTLISKAEAIVRLDVLTKKTNK